MSDVITVAEAAPSSDLPWRKIATTFEDDDDDHEQIEFKAETNIGTYFVGPAALFEFGYAVAFKIAGKRDRWCSICIICPSVEMAKEIAAYHYAQSTAIK